MFVATSLDGSTLDVRIAGRWLIDNSAAISAELAALEAQPARSVRVDASGAEELDLTGAWLLIDWLHQLEGQGRRIDWQGRRPDQFEIVQKAFGRKIERSVGLDLDVDLSEPVRTIGRWSLEQLENARSSLAFFGRICSVLGQAFLNPRRLRLPGLVRHIFETGVLAIPIVSLIAFLISVIVAYLGAHELRRFGAEIFVVDLVTVAVLRELGVLLTAIIVAGRSGSAFAAEIGVMKLNEEVDALQAIGTNPIEVLVTPRVLGLIITMPLLTVIADAVGLIGGGMLCYYLLDIPVAQYMARVQESIAPTTFWVGIIKAPVFAFLIAFVGTLRGMQVRDSSRELGRLTTVAVVQSIFLVILADAIFAVIFLELDI